ncbi:DUF4168 domain-containing protein [Rhodobacteraceae bacterium 2CG4]|uniref:DUF4168 domain-containing protein n=1 Tax=Halovulum marinum TaxID=2662447 RepID=A0A6L5YX32_9RHOB|nr:DUF4168 domain-containing protein [Halovulum marinum]MSU88906.1 DUF4168 domain-containing protein [Halovulum marinum]
MTCKKTITRFAAATAAALTLGAALPAAAQTGAETGAETGTQTLPGTAADPMAPPPAPETSAKPAAPLPGAAQPDASAAFSDEKLEAFVSAVSDVRDIGFDYSAQLEAVEDEAERSALIAEAETAMVAAIEGTPNLTVEEYQQIGVRAQQDEALGQRIAAIISEAPAQ